VRPAEQSRPDIARRRQRWINAFKSVDTQRLVFVDETWVKTNMAPLYGWGPIGERVVTDDPHGHWKTMTFIAALRRDRVCAPFVLDGPINGELFLAWIIEQLVPTLKPGDIVIVDNLGSHKSAAARVAVRAAGGHLIFLPPYSPDLNPIEQVFAKLKQLLRRMKTRTVEATHHALGQVLAAFEPTECANYLAHAGYVSM
jgi:transposase